MIETSEFSECRDCACAAARREAVRLARLYDERLRPYGLTSNQFTLLTTLIIGGAARISTLAERLGIDRTTLSRNVAVELGQGLVAIESGSDARERMVVLTPAGRRAAEAALPAWRAAQAEALKG